MHKQCCPVGEVDYKGLQDEFVVARRSLIRGEAVVHDTALIDAAKPGVQGIGAECQVGHRPRCVTPDEVDGLEYKT